MSAILFAGLGLILLAGGSQPLWPVAAIVAAMLVIEAALRRHLIALLVNLAVAALVVTDAWTVARLLLVNLRLGAGVLLRLAAGYMCVQTLADALIHRQGQRRTTADTRQHDEGVAR